MSVPTQVLMHLHPERHDQVNNQWRTQRQERSINKVKPDTTGRNIHFFTQKGADAKSLFFDKESEFIHKVYRQGVLVLGKSLECTTLSQFSLFNVLIQTRYAIYLTVLK